jgi:hypothetical protein
LKECVVPKDVICGEITDRGREIRTSQSGKGDLTGECVDNCILIVHSRCDIAELVKKRPIQAHHVPVHKLPNINPSPGSQINGSYSRAQKLIGGSQIARLFMDAPIRVEGYNIRVLSAVVEFCVIYVQCPLVIGNEIRS